MTKRQMIEMLKDVPDDFEVVLSGDAEGNYFSPLADFGIGCYIPETTYNGEFFMGDEIDTDNGEKENCVVLWPVN